MTPALAVAALGFLTAFVNGGNDVSKGSATLVGSGVTDYRRAILWGTLWTGAGGLLAAPFAHAMVATFGRGLLAPSVAPSAAAAVAVMIGATAWVLIATGLGIPVSTTVLAERVTRLGHRDGFAANLVTAGLVGLGAVTGLPMSTTHVSCGAIIGAGFQRGASGLHRQTIGHILLAWVVKIPASAALGALALAGIRAW